MVLEKALVKSLGGYHKLFNSTASVNEFLRDFTNAPCLKVNLDNPNFKDVLKLSLERKELVFFEMLSLPFPVVDLEDQSVIFKCSFPLETLVSSEFVHHLGRNDYFLSLEEISLIKQLEGDLSSLDFNILKICNRFEYNSIHVPLSANNYIQSILKLGIQEEGEYYISVVQKSKDLYPLNSFCYNKCTLTIGKLIEGGVEYVDTITSENQRETQMKVTTTDSDCYLIALIDVECNQHNYQHEQSYASEAEGLTHWRDVVLTVYGNYYCRLDSLALDKNRQMIYDFFLHRIWKDYAKRSQKSSESQEKQD